MVNGYLTDFDRLNMYCIDASCHLIGFPRKISEMPSASVALKRTSGVSGILWFPASHGTSWCCFCCCFLVCGFNCCRKKHVCLKKYTMMTLMIQMMIDFDRPKRLQYCVIRREVYSTLCMWPWATQVKMVSKLDSTGGSCLQLSWHYDILNGGWLATLQQSNFNQTRQWMLAVFSGKSWNTLWIYIYMGMGQYL